MDPTIVILLIISLALSFTYSLSRKTYTARVTGSLAPIFLFNAVASVAAIAVLILMGGIGTISPFTFLLALLFGLATLIQQIASLEAIRTGPLSLTSTLLSCSTIIPAASGAVLFGEELKLAHIIGIVLMIMSFFFAVERSENERRASFRWLVLCLIGFLASGSIGTMQKIHQNTEYRGELNGFLVIAFLFSLLSSVIACIVYLVKNKHAHKPKFEISTKEAIIMVSLMLIAGASFGAVNNLNLYLSGVMESAVFFPIVNGGTLVLTTLAAFIIFKERLTKKQWAGVIVGIASVIFLCNPFG